MKAYLRLQMFDGRELEVSFDQSPEIINKEAYRMMISNLTMALDMEMPEGEPLNEAQRNLDLSRILLGQMGGH